MDGTRARLQINKWITMLQDGRIHSSMKTDMTLNIRVEIKIDWSSQTWNLEPIFSLISEEKARAVQLLPLVNNLEKDHIIWPEERYEVYSLKTGYHCIHNTHVRNIMRRSFVSSIINPEVCKLIWHAEVPPKVSYFLWRPLNGHMNTA